MALSLALITANETVGSLAGSGFVSLGARTLTTGGNNASTTYAGVISSTEVTSALVKEGSGTLEVTSMGGLAGDIPVNKAGSKFVISGGTNVLGIDPFVIIPRVTVGAEATFVFKSADVCRYPRRGGASAQCFPDFGHTCIRRGDD